MLDSSKLKEFADDVKLDENGREFFKWVENTVDKEEIACNNISPLPSVFKRLVLQTRKSRPCFGKG